MSRSCVEERINSDGECPKGREKITSEFNKQVCRKICPENWKEKEKHGEYTCGVHQYCKEELIIVPFENIDSSKEKQNITKRHYCETPRCDVNGEVSMQIKGNEIMRNYQNYKQN